MHDTLTYIFTRIRHEIPEELLTLAFKPSEHNTTIENRIRKKIIEGPILLDTNLLGGKRRDIVLRAEWEMDLGQDDTVALIGNGVQNAYYKVPPSARENRNIASVIGVEPSQYSGIPGSSVMMNGAPSYGVTAAAGLQELLNTRTFANYVIPPRATTQGNNIICLQPRQMLEGIIISVLLEYDSEFINMNRSAIKALENLCLCATKRYIATTLRISVDETEVVAGMEIGIIKELINNYSEKGEEYASLLTRLQGAMLADSATLSRLIGYAM